MDKDLAEIVKKRNKSFGNFNSSDWKWLSERDDLTEKIIEDYAGELHWEMLCRLQPLSLDIIKKLEDKVSFFYLSFNTKISEEVFDKYYEKCDPRILWVNQDFSEDFIRRYKSSGYANEISRYQRMSYEFIIGNIDVINIFSLRLNEKVSLTEEQWGTISSIFTLKETFHI